MDSTTRKGILIAFVTALLILLEYLSATKINMPCSANKKLWIAEELEHCRNMLPPIDIGHSHHTVESTDGMVIPYVKNDSDVSFDVCKNATLAKPHSFPVSALVSFPGSGNTWLRYLLERASGFYTGSVYKDMGLYRGGFKGEVEAPGKGTTLIVKTHMMRKIKQSMMFERAVLIVRNPYNSLLALANYNSHGHTGHASPQYFNSKGWDTFVEKESPNWGNLITSWVALNNTLVVLYEDLQSGLRQQITRIHEFLGLPLNEARLKCMVAYPEGKFHRKKKKNYEAIDPYTTKHEDIIEMHINAASKLLLDKGYIMNNLPYSRRKKKNE